MAYKFRSGDIVDHRRYGIGTFLFYERKPGFCDCYVDFGGEGYRFDCISWELTLYATAHRILLTERMDDV